MTKHASKINFEEDTNVRNCTDYSCPTDGFEFTAFKHVLHRKIDTNVAFGSLYNFNSLIV